MRLQGMIGVVAATLLGCGGGGGGSGTGSGDSGATPTPVDGDYCEPVESWTPAMTEFEEDVIVLVNEARAAGASCGGTAYGPAGSVSLNTALRCSARVHSQDMAIQGFFDHVNPDGEDPFDRMTLAGYDYATAAENIAAGQLTPQLVMSGWMASPGHCANIMNPAFTELGVGAYEAAASEYPIYWTQNFGSP